MIEKKKLVAEAPEQNSVRQALKDIADEYRGKGHGNRAWTTVIKSRMIELGHQRNWLVCTAGATKPKADWGEWLYDLCWIKNAASKPYDMFREMGLAMEIEWSTTTDAIVEDFQKLLCAKAGHKVMVFQEHPDLLPFMKKSISLWKEKEGTYLVARFVNAKEEFAFSVI